MLHLRISLFGLLALVSLPATAKADSYVFHFTISAQATDLVSATGDPKCGAALQSVVEESKKSAPAEWRCLYYNGIRSCVPQESHPGQHTVQKPFYAGNAPFELDSDTQLSQGYELKRVFSGKLFDETGRLELTAATCELAYGATYSFSDFE